MRRAARANLPRVSFPDARAGTRVSTCRLSWRPPRKSGGKAHTVRSSPVGSGVVSRIRTRFTRTSFKQKARRSTSTIDRRRRRTVPSYGSADDPPRRRRLGRRPAPSIGETLVSFIVGTSAVDPSIHRSSRAARLTNTLVRSRALWDLSRPLSSSARGTRAPPRVEARVPAGVWKRGSCRPRVPPRTRPRAGRRPRTPGP